MLDEAGDSHDRCATVFVGGEAVVDSGVEAGRKTDDVDGLVG